MSDFDPSLEEIIRSFARTLTDRAEDSVIDVLRGRRGQLDRATLNQDPEQFVCQYLVWPVCRAMHYNHVTEWYHGGYDGSTDLYLPLSDTTLLGEVKRPNGYRLALNDLHDYLAHRTAPTSYGIATDGIVWLFVEAPDDRRKNPKIICHHSFRDALFTLLVDIGAVERSKTGANVTNRSSLATILGDSYTDRLRPESIADSVADFQAAFGPDKLNTLAGFGDTAYDSTLTDTEMEDGDLTDDTGQTHSLDYFTDDSS